MNLELQIRLFLFWNAFGSAILLFSLEINISSSEK